MTIFELIEELQKYLGDFKVFISALEDGYCESKQITGRHFVFDEDHDIAEHWNGEWSIDYVNENINGVMIR